MDNQFPKFLDDKPKEFKEGKEDDFKSDISI